MSVGRFVLPQTKKNDNESHRARNCKDNQWQWWLELHSHWGEDCPESSKGRCYAGALPLDFVPKELMVGEIAKVEDRGNAYAGSEEEKVLQIDRVLADYHHNSRNHTNKKAQEERLF